MSQGNHLIQHPNSNFSLEYHQSKSLMFIFPSGILYFRSTFRCPCNLGLVHVNWQVYSLQFTLEMKWTYYFQLVCYVVCDGGLGIKPEDRQQHWPQICEEWANVGVRSQLQNDLQPHEHLGGYRGALLDCDAGRVELVIRFETPLIKCKTKC